MWARGVGLRPKEKSLDLQPNPKVARVAFLSRLQGLSGDQHPYRDHISLNRDVNKLSAVGTGRGDELKWLQKSQ